MKTGTVVKLKVNCLDNKSGAIGVCYEEYDIGEPGAGSVIFQNGKYDGFSPNEQENFLTQIGFDLAVSHYRFENVMKLSNDFGDGIFDGVFAKYNASKFI